MRTWVCAPICQLFMLRVMYLAQLSGTYHATKQGNFIIFLGWGYLDSFQINNKYKNK
jgi:hypothetical protein